MARGCGSDGSIQMLVSDFNFMNPSLALFTRNESSVMLKYALSFSSKSECYRREQDCRYPSVRVSAMPHSRVLTSRLRSRVVDNEGF